jgi:hypothetical protein
MKTLTLLALCAAAAFAQTPTPPPAPASGAYAPAPAGLAIKPHVTVTIVDQGIAPMQLVTGVKIATATLLDATSCNETETDEVVDNSMVYQRINSGTAQVLTLYDSQVVADVLTVFQDKNVFAKLFRGGAAASTVGVILTSALKLNPITSVALAIAPQIYSAVLPIIHSAEDLRTLINNIVPQNSGTKLAGHSCRSGLVVARTSAPVRTEVIPVQ